MRCTLFHPPRPGATNTVPPLGLLSLASVLEANGHRAVLVDAALSGETGSALRETLKKTDPEILLITAFSSDVAVLRSELPGIRRELGNIPFLLGGPHSSCRGLEALSDLPEADTVFLGEAEETLPRFLEAPEKRLPGVISRRDPWPGKPVHVNDLSVLPIPAWRLAPPAGYRGLPNGVILKKTPFAPVITTRGCPYRCTFCAGFRITGHRIRHRPLELVWEEIDLLVNEFGVKEIHIEDDNFTFNADYAKEFCRMALKRKPGLHFSTPNGVRLDTLDRELLNLMKRAGWYIIHCGVESGSDRVLRSVNKSLSTAVIAEKIALIRSCGLPTAGYFILGLPGETREDMEKTIAFAVSSGLDWAQFASFLPIPGSAAGDRWFEEHGYTEKLWQNFHNTRCPAPPKGVTRRELMLLQRRAFMKFYLRPGPLFRIAGQFLRPKVVPYLVKRFLAYLHSSGVDPDASSE